MRIVFFGTPAFAVPALRALLEEGADIAAVVTQPDRPQGRSRSTLVPPPVKALAQEHGLEVLQPDKPAGDLFAAQLRRLEPELGVVIAYGHILRPAILAIPPRGMLNVHASLLPRHRGAAPIQHAILAGDIHTGITIMQMDAGMDTGPMLHTAETPIGSSETAGELTTRLAALGAESLVEALALLRLGRLTPTPQDDADATYAPKIDRDQARIRWEESGDAVARRIRAFDPVPGAWATLGGQDVKLFGATVAEGRGDPGAVLAAADTMLIACGTDAVRVRAIQPAGKKRMPVQAWASGHADAPGLRLA